jgi:dolichol kinase
MAHNNLHLSRRVQHLLTGIALLLISHILPSPYPVGFILLSLATGAFYCIHIKRVHDEEWDGWYLDKFGELLRGHERGEWCDEDENDEGRSNTGNNTIQQQQPQHNDNNKRRRRRRRKVQPALPGAFYFLLGTTLSTLFFSTSIARTALLVLSVSDPIAGLVGVSFSDIGCNTSWKKLWGKLSGRNVGSKGEEGPTVAGSLACALSTVVCTYVYIPSVAIATTLATIPTLTLSSRILIGISTAFVEAVAGRQFPLIGDVMDDNLLIPIVVGGMLSWLE